MRTDSFEPRIEGLPSHVGEDIVVTLQARVFNQSSHVTPKISLIEVLMGSLTEHNITVAGLLTIDYGPGIHLLDIPQAICTTRFVSALLAD